MSTHMPGFQYFFMKFFASFCIGQISHQQRKGYEQTESWNMNNQFSKAFHWVLPCWGDIFTFSTHVLVFFLLYLECVHYLIILNKTY